MVSTFFLLFWKKRTDIIYAKDLRKDGETLLVPIYMTGLL